MQIHLLELNLDKKPIKDIKIGESVLTHEDRYRKVEVYGNLQIGEWIGSDTLDCGDSGELITYYTLSYIINECTNFFIGC